MRTLVLALSVTLSAFAAARTASVTGNWHDTATWGGSAAPVAGDTATINNSITVTCESGQTCTAGTSPGSYYSYISSFTVSNPPAGSGTCTVTVSGGTQAGSGIFGAQRTACTWSGGVVSVVPAFPITLYTTASATPTASISCTGCAGAGTAVAVVWSAGAATPAIQLSGSGKLVVAGTLNALGWIVYTSGAANTANGVEMAAGGTLKFDATAASTLADGRFPYYAYAPDQTSNPGIRAIGVNGSSPCSGAVGSGTRCAITATTGTPAGFTGAGFVSGSGPINLHHTDFSNLGNSFIPWRSMYPTGTGIGHQVTDSTFDNCGSADDLNTLGQAAVWIHDRNTHTNSVAPVGRQGKLFPTTGATSTITTGTRELVANVMDGGGFNDQFQCAAFTITDNYATASGTTNSQAFTCSGAGASLPAWASFQRNLMVSISPGAASPVMAGPFGNNYDFFYTSGACTNVHIWQFGGSNISGAPFAATGNIAECADKLIGDSGEVWQGSSQSSSPGTYTGQNNIVLPAADGFSWAEHAAMAFSNFVMQFLHNTFYGVYSSGVAGNGKFGMSQLEENITLPAGSVPAVKSNILYNPGTTSAGLHGAYIAQDINATPTTDILTPANADYNDNYNGEPTYTACGGGGACTNQGLGYAAKFSAATYGTHDLAADPRFANYQTSIVLFDQKYLAVAQGGAWASGTSYATGDVVSHAVAGTWWGLTVNYRCFNLSGCSGAAEEPGILGASSGNWKTFWEPNSLYQIRSRLGANYVTIVDGALDAGDGTCTPVSPCSVIQALVSFTRRRYTPQNPALWQAGHDAKTIGAVDLSTRGPAMVGAIQ